MSFRKLLISGILSASIIASTSVMGFAQSVTYTVQPGDTFWKVSEKFHVSIFELMDANNSNENTMLYVGQKLAIPSGTDEEEIHTVQWGDTYWIISQKYNVDIHTLMSANSATQSTVLNIGDKVIIPAANEPPQEAAYTVQAGDTYWIISQKLGVDIIKLMEYNGANQNTVLYIGQKIKYPSSEAPDTVSPPAPVPDSSGPYITYDNYTVKSGDYFWGISIKFGITVPELLKANNMTESTVLKVGDVLKIPVHHVPEKQTPGEKYGEYLDWWTEAQYVIPANSVFEVVDFYTGKSFMAKRTTGASHADVETLTLDDTNKMKEIWGGSLSWARRPVIIKYNGRKLAASVSSMPHAGNDGAAGGIYTSWRSGGYSAGYNFDWIKGNGIDGVFDIHFLNSTRHSDNTVDQEHQKNIRIAAGI